MRPMIIAKAKKGKDIAVFRMIDMDKVGLRVSKLDTVDQPYNNVVAFMQKGGNMVNATLDDGKVVGTNGNLDKYPDIGTGGSIVILKDLDGLGFMVADSNGVVKKVGESDLVKFGNKFGIANAKIVNRNGTEFISAIAGNFEVLNMNIDKNKQKDLGIRIGLSNGRTTLGKNIGRHVDVEIDDNDVFECLSDNQRKILVDYYVWYTTRLYKSMSQHARWDIPVDKVAKLAELRGAGSWEFAGIIDSYLSKRYHAKCTLGHNLRYEFVAVSEEVNGSRKRIVFGSTCSGDFFEISKEDMAKLVKAREIMTNEINLITFAIANNQQDELTGKIRLFYRFLAILQEKENIMALFGREIGGAILNFVGNNLPIPESLVILASEKLSKTDLGVIFKFIGMEKQWNILNANGESRRAAYGLLTAIKFVFFTQIEGEYMYDPYNENHKRRDIGAYNKDTRAARDRIIRDCKTYLNLKSYRVVRYDLTKYGLDNSLYPNGAAFYEQDLMKILESIKTSADNIEFYVDIERVLTEQALKFAEEFPSKQIEYEYDGYRYAKRLRTLIPPYGQTAIDIMNKVSYRYGHYISYSYSKDAEVDKEALEKEVITTKKQEVINAIVNDFEQYFQSKREEISERERLIAEKERQEKERIAERERMAKEKEEEEALKQVLEEKRKAGESLIGDVKSNVIPLNEVSVADLKKQLNKLPKNNKIREEWSVKVFTDIADRKLEYKDLTDKQQHVVDIVNGLLNGNPKCVVLKEFRESLEQIKQVLGETDNGFKISCDIAKKCANDTDLSAKQLWRVKNTLERFKENL